MLRDFQHAVTRRHAPKKKFPKYLHFSRITLQNRHTAKTPKRRERKNARNAKDRGGYCPSNRNRPNRVPWHAMGIRHHQVTNTHERKKTKMPKFKVTRTEEATVWASNEEEATEKAIEEMQNLPNGDYEIEQLTPSHNLHQILWLLEGEGLTVYLDEWKNNIHDFIRLDIDQTRPVDEYRFVLACHLNDEEEYSGTGYTLLTQEAVDVQQFGHDEPATIAKAVAVAVAEWVKANPATVELEASLEEIAELLTRMGKAARVVEKPWLDLPAFIAIGECGFCNMQPDATTHQTPAFTLTYEMNQAGVSGTGYRLNRGGGDCETVLEIPNETAFRVVSQIIFAMGQLSKGVTA